MNANTILAFKGGTGRNQIASLVGTAGDFTTATAATINTDSGTAATAVLRIPLQSAILGSGQPLSGNAAILGPAYSQFVRAPRGSQAPYFNSASFEGVPFRVRAHGTANMGANGAQTLLISLCLGTSSVIGNNVVIGTTGAALATVAGGACAFSIVSEIIWSIGSGANGNIASRHSATIAFLVTPTRQVVSDVIQTNATAAAAAASNLAFTVFATAGNGAASSVQFTEFALEAV